METQNFNTSAVSGTCGGTLLVLLLQIDWQDILQTALIAAVGAASSFIVSMILQYVTRRLLRNKATIEK